MSELIYRRRYEYPIDICLNVTDACNLQCRYCFVEQHPHFMTLDIAKKSVEFLMNNLEISKKNKWVNEDYAASIVYFGGEPTLLFDEIIRPLTEWATQTYGEKYITYSITTNGTLLNAERIKFLKDYNIGPLLSIDGAPETQNFNRPCRDNSINSFDLVEKNIPLLLEAFPNITFRSTISQEKVDKIFENYIFAAASGFKNVFMMPNGRERWSTASIIEMDKQVQKIYNLLLENFRNGEKPIINCSPIEKSFERVLQHDLKIRDNIKDWENCSRNVDRCGLGTNGCAINYEGNIFGCQEQPSQASSDLFCIGNIFTGIDRKKHLQLLEEYNKPKTIECEDKELCSSCELRNICLTYACPSTSWSLFRNTTTMSLSNCMWERMLFHYAAQIMNILVKENNKLFEQYLNEQCNYKEYFKNSGDE